MVKLSILIFSPKTSNILNFYNCWWWEVIEPLFLKVDLSVLATTRFVIEVRVVLSTYSSKNIINCGTYIFTVCYTYIFFCMHGKGAVTIYANHIRGAVTV